MDSAIENKISTEKENGFRRFWHRITKHSRNDHEEKTAPTKGLIPPPVEKARPSTPAPKNIKPQQHGADTGTEGVKDEAKIGNGSNNQGHVEEHGRDKNEQIENSDQPGASDGERLAHQHGLKRDLWSEAWKSPKLVDVKERLESPWKDPYGSAPDKPLRVPKGPKNAKGPKSPQGLTTSLAHEDSDGHTASKEVELPRQLVVEVLHRTKTRMATYEERWGSESESTIAGTARDALLSALVVKDLVDAGLAFDPTGYGACGWAVVSFGLKLIENDKVRMENAFKATGYLTETLARYAKIQRFCREVTTTTEVHDLEDSIVEVYIAILRYSAEVKKADEGSYLNRFSESFHALTGQPLEKLQQPVDKEDNTVKKWYDQVNDAYQREYLRRTKKNIEDMQNEVRRDLANIKNDLALTKEAVFLMLEGDMLERLSDSKNNPSIQKHEILREAISKVKGENYKAGEWIFRDADYLKWEANPQSILWLWGESGDGKSSLCSTIIERLKSRCELPESRKILVYWYFQFDKPDTKDLRLPVQSFLRQLASDGRFPEKIHEWLRENLLSYDKNKLTILVQKLDLFIRELEKDVFIVLDGIDEFPDEAKETQREKMIDLVSKLAKAGYPNIHLLIVSKNDNDIRKLLKQDDDLKDVVVDRDVTDEQRSELEKFITTTMEQDDRLGKFESGTKDSIKRRLNESKGKDKNFLWVTSVLNELRRCDEGLIPEQLKKVPVNMALRYENALRGVDEINEKYMRLILMWLLRYQRTDMPLTQEEIAKAVGLHEVSMVTQICANSLVKLSRRTRKTSKGDDVEGTFVEFVHFSAKEHLEYVLQTSPEPKISRFSFSDEEAHCEIATQCLQVLESQPAQAVLLDYAANFWFKHYLLLVDKIRTSKDKAAEEKTPKGKAAVEEMSRKVTELDGLVDGLFKSGSTALESWLGCFSPDMGFKASSDFDMEATESEDEDEDEDEDDGKKMRADPVYYAVKLELFDVAKRLIADGAPYIKPGKEGTVLQLALYRKTAKYIEVADALLGLEATDKTAVMAQAGPHGTPLYIVSAHGIRNMAEKLVDKGATADGSADGRYGSALHAAAYYGNTDIAALLLKKGQAKVDQQSGFFGTALQAASSQGHVGVVKLLLTTYKANPKIMAGHLGTALQAALTTKRSASVVAALRKAGVEFRESSGTDADWRSACNRVEKSSRAFFQRYMEIFQMPKGEQLSPQQALLVVALDRWHLPTTRLLDRFLFAMDLGYPYKVALQEKLEEIRRALPTFDSTNAYELSRENFLYKALFWSGIDYILQRLVPLVLYGIVSMENIIERRGSLSIDNQGRPDESEFAFRFQTMGPPWVPNWFQFLSSLSRPRFSRRNTPYGLMWGSDDTEYIWTRFGRVQYEWSELYYGSRRNLDMDTSDKIALETLRQQELARQRQDQHEDTAKGPGGGKGKGKTGIQTERSPSPGTGSVDTVMTRLAGWRGQRRWWGGWAWADDGDSDMIGGGGLGPGPNDGTPVHLVVSDLLSLVEDLVRFGKQCDRLHDTVQKASRRGSSSGGTGTSKQTQTTIGDLTFEVFAAVARLAVALGTESYFPSPEQTVLLLTTVRLPRITKLAAACEQQMMDDGIAGTAFSPAANINTEKLVNDVAAAVVDQLKGLLDKQATQIQSKVAQLEQRLPKLRLDDGSSNNASGTVIPVASAANGDSSTHGLNSFFSSSEFQDQIRDAVRHEVKTQVHGTETASLQENGQPRRRWLWPL